MLYLDPDGVRNYDLCICNLFYTSCDKTIVMTNKITLKLVLKLCHAQNHFLEQIIHNVSSVEGMECFKF